MTQRIRVGLFFLLSLAGLLAQPVPPPKLWAVRLTTGPAWDPARKPNEQAGMIEHGTNIARMRREGALVLGARYGDTGLMVFRVADESAVHAQFADDPTIAAGVFKMQVDVFAPFAHGTTAWLTTPEAITLRAYLDAYNRHESEAVAALLAPDVKWLSLDAEKLTVDGDGRGALRIWLAGYFNSLPDVRSEFLSIEQTGAFLSVRERASWTAKDGIRRSQQSHGVYEIRDSLIARAWYFPSVRDPALTPR